MRAHTDRFDRLIYGMRNSKAVTHRQESSKTLLRPRREYNREYNRAGWHCCKAEADLQACDDGSEREQISMENESTFAARRDFDLDFAQNFTANEVRFRY